MKKTHNIREDFPMFVENPSFNYFDNAATTQKPEIVLAAIQEYYTYANENVHRGRNLLSERSTDIFEKGRANIAKFINAATPENVVFTKNATEGVNLIACAFCKEYLKAGDTIVSTYMEHHSNILPFLAVCNDKKESNVNVHFKYAPIKQDGALDIDRFKNIIETEASIRLVAFTAMSNVTGIVNPVKDLVALCHSKNIPVLVDATQYIAHYPINVADWNCDFLVFSGHKLYAPMGIGVLYARTSFLDKIAAYQYGGGMMELVKYSPELKETIIKLRGIPAKFEAGTPNVEGVLGLSTAIDYLQGIGYGEIAAHEQALHNQLRDGMLKLGDRIKIAASEAESHAITTFTVDGIENDVLADYFNKSSIFLRDGAHCAHPYMNALGFNNGGLRVSIGVYNTAGEIDYFLQVLSKALMLNPVQ